MQCRRTCLQQRSAVRFLLSSRSIKFAVSLEPRIVRIPARNPIYRHVMIAKRLLHFALISSSASQVIDMLRWVLFICPGPGVWPLGFCLTCNVQPRINIIIKNRLFHQLLANKGSKRQIIWLQYVYDANASNGI